MKNLTKTQKEKIKGFWLIYDVNQYKNSIDFTIDWINDTLFNMKKIINK